MFLIKCPHCDIDIDIVQINCGIFRCGMIIKEENGKKVLVQIDPHLPKEQCDKLENVVGCRGPFRVINGVAVKCDYI